MYKYSDNDKIWVQKDGYSIFVESMGDAHIKNTIKMLQRKIDGLRYLNSFWISTIPDECDFALAADFEEELEPLHKWIKVLKKEQNRRK